MASKLRSKIKQIKPIPWPPQVAELEQEETLPTLVVQLISSLKKPKHDEHDSKARALGSMITYYVTGKPTITTTNLRMNSHGLTRSKELVDTFHKCGVCIGYSLVLLLRDAWAVHDLQLCAECPNEIAVNTPGVIIVDNEDFRNDTLTGGDTSHRTNVMYVQPFTLEHHGSGDGERIKKGKVLSSKLKEIAEGMTSHERYITRKRGEPVVCDRVQLKRRSTEIQRKRFLIHALVCANNAGKRPLPVDQMFPSFFGFVL